MNTHRRRCLELNAEPLITQNICRKFFLCVFPKHFGQPYLIFHDLINGVMLLFFYHTECESFSSSELIAWFSYSQFFISKSSKERTEKQFIANMGASSITTKTLSVGERDNKDLTTFYKAAQRLLIRPSLLLVAIVFNARRGNSTLYMFLVGGISLSLVVVMRQQSENWIFEAEK